MKKDETRRHMAIVRDLKTLHDTDKFLATMIGISLVCSIAAFALSIIGVLK